MNQELIKDMAHFSATREVNNGNTTPFSELVEAFFNAFMVMYGQAA